MSNDFIVPNIVQKNNYELEELVEINTKLDGIVENAKAIRESNEEQGFLLRLILAVHATNAGLVKPHEDLATDIKNTLDDRGIMVEVAGSEPSKDL
jgi:hypothetical protein